VRTLSITDARAALVGGAVMGCGGGGEIAEGMELVERYAAEGFELHLAEVDELPQSAMVVCPYGVGSLDPDLDDPSYRGLTVAAEYPALTAVKDLQQHMGITFDAVISGELGGWALADAFYVAAALKVPLLDADPAGRAVPEVQHSLLYVGGISITPQVITNEFGESIVVQRVANDFRDEALVRTFSTISRGTAWVADHPAPLADVRRASIPGAISMAERVGRAFMDHESSGDAATAVAAAGAGCVLFGGTIGSCSYEDRDGFTFGEFTVTGERLHQGSELRIWYKNENLISWLDGEVFVTTPDLLCVLDEDLHEPLTNPHAEVGKRVAIVGLPAPAQWRTQAGLDVFGPRTFGFEVDYRSLEEVTGSDAERSLP